MNLLNLYDSLWEQSKNNILNNNYNIDNYLNSTKDNRRGITLLTRLNIDILKNIQHFINESMVIEPEQYFYKNTDIHCTILTIISCYDGFKLDLIKIDDYINIIKKALLSIKNFKIEFKGITASDSCIMIQGFPLDNSIDIIRDNIRKSFKSLKLANSIDKRYSKKTSHCTVIRFKKKLNNPIKFIRLIEKYKNYNFGTSNIKELEFVHTDWYQNIKNNKKLSVFKLL